MYDMILNPIILYDIFYFHIIWYPVLSCNIKLFLFWQPSSITLFHHRKWMAHKKNRKIYSLTQQFQVFFGNLIFKYSVKMFFFTCFIFVQFLVYTSVMIFISSVSTSLLLIPCDRSSWGWDVPFVPLSPSLSSLLFISLTARTSAHGILKS